MSNFSIRLKELRRANNVSQAELAAHIGYAASTISNYENNGHEPSIPTFIDIINFFGVTSDYMLGITDEPGPLTEEECRMLQAYRNLSDEDKAALLESLVQK